MKKNTLTYLLIAGIVIGLIVLGNFFIKPNYNSKNENPYSLKIDSIGQIAAVDFCDVSYSKIDISLNKAIAIAVDKNNNTYISGDNKIIILSKNGTKTDEFATEITATALIVGDNILCAAFKNKVELFTLEGKPIKNWSDLSEKAYITSLAVIADQIFVSDAESALVYKYSLDGKLLQTIGSKADKNEMNSFILPSYYFDVAIAPDNSLWVANTGRHKLVNFDNEGKMLSFWGDTSSGVEGFCGCCNPSHFAIMSDGSFITSEKGIVRVKKYNSAGVFECALAGQEYFTENATGLDIAINTNDEILVLEPDASTLHIFKINN